MAEHPTALLYIYLALINAALFVVMGADKAFARRHARRVPEATLFFLAVVGGSAGGILGMLCFRHKTKHAQFVIGFPLIFVLQLALAVWLAVK